MTGLWFGFDGPVSIPTDPPSWTTFLAVQPQPVPVLPALGVLLALVYLVGYVRLRAAGRPWPWWQAGSFLTGCLVLVLTTGTAVEGYGLEMFSVFLFQQLTLMMAVPPLLVLGRPGTLFLRATPHGRIGRLFLGAGLWGLRSGAGRFLLHPGVTVPLFLLSYYGLYFSPAAGALLSTLPGHVLAELAFLGCGILFTVPVLSRDPLPRRHGHGLQVGEMFVEMATHAFFGVIIIMSATPIVSAFTHPPAAWDVDLLGDQAVAGALAWSYGELPALLLLLIVLSRWRRSDVRAAALSDARIEREGNHELDAYNAYLDQLRRRQ